MSAPLPFSSPLPAAVWSPSFDLSVYTHTELRQFALAVFQEATCMEQERRHTQEGETTKARMRDMETADDDSYHIPLDSLARFLASVESAHHIENVYHGWTHGVHVLWNTFRFLHPVRHHFTNVEMLTLLLSSVCHDLAHCGCANGWCVENQYVMNPDHGRKKYTRNMLEQNSVDRTVEILTGVPLSRPTGLVDPLPSTPSATPVAATSPHNYLLEWGMSPSLQASIIANLTEYILSTDIGDRERHQRVTGEFAQLTQPLSVPANNKTNEPNHNPPSDTNTSMTDHGSSDDDDSDDVDCDEFDACVNEDRMFDATIELHRERASSSSSSSSSVSSISGQLLSTVVGDIAAMKKRRTSSSAASAYGVIRKKPRRSSVVTSFSYTRRSHRFILTRLLLLCADIGCVSETFPLVVSWADRLYEESQLGRNFVAHAAENIDRINDTEEAEIVRKGTPLIRRHVVSQYRLEANARPIATPLMDASTSLNESESSLSSSPSPSSYRLVPCVDMSTYYSNQLRFFSGYAIPLYEPLYLSQLLPTMSGIFQRLKRNYQFLCKIEFVKPFNQKMEVHVRRRRRTTTMTTTINPTDIKDGESTPNDDDRDMIDQLTREYDAIDRQYSEMNAQRFRCGEMPIKRLVFHCSTNVDDDPNPPSPSPSTTSNNHNDSTPEPHQQHELDHNVACINHTS